MVAQNAETNIKYNYRSYNTTELYSVLCDLLTCVRLRMCYSADVPSRCHHSVECTSV